MSRKSRDVPSIDIKAFLGLINITETSRKDEVITSACELVDQQDAVIKDLQGKQKTVFVLNS